MADSNRTDAEKALLSEMYDGVIAGDEDKCVAAAEASIEAGIAPLVSIEEGLTPGIREVGDRFGRMEMFLPEMVLSANAMQAAVGVLEPHFAEGDNAKKGKIIIGTVKGDIHDIGKNIARALLTVNGYDVIDLGRDVDLTDFIDVAEKEGVDIIGMSGLLSTSLPLMRDTIKMMHDDEVREKYQVIIGGGPTSQEYADQIGADAYAETAFDGVDICDRMMGVEA